MGLSLDVRLFFEFLQVAVGNRKSLSEAINDSDWQGLFEFCKRQALIGVGFSAVEKLHAVGVVCPSVIRMQWMALAFQIEKRNALLNEQCKKLTEQYGHDGLSTCILKGQGNCLNYPEELRNRRQCGDIDVWTTLMKDERLRINDYLHTEDRERQGCPQADVSSERELPRINREFKEIGPQADNGIAIAVQTGRNEVEYVEYHGRKAVIEYVRMQHRLAGNDERPVIRYHHIEAPKMEGTEVEAHFRVGFVNSPIRNWKMQRWIDAHADVCMKNKIHMGFAVPTSSVNVVYQMCHLFSHYFDEGLGLRQLMDYYFALRVWYNDVMECNDLQSQGMWSEGFGTPVMSASEVMAVLRSFGMAKFAGAVMWVLHEVFGMPPHYYICEPNEKEGRKLLADIMQGGNFGQYDARDAALKKGGMMKHGVWKLKRVMRLVSSYPEEALWEPAFRAYHLVWRGING